MTASREAGIAGAWGVSTGRRAHWMAAILSCIGIAVMLAMAATNSASWNVDFTQFYTAGSLVGTGKLFDWPTIQALEFKHSSTAVPYIRLPFFALPFKPLSALPYDAARGLFLGLEIATLAGFLALWPFSRKRWAWVAACWCAPAAICLAFGQDSVLFLFFLALGLRLLLTPGNRLDFWAGVALSICSSKPHIAVLIPLVLIAHARWRALLGGLAGGAVIVAISFAVEGADWPARYLALARLPDFEHAINRMPNMRGLLAFFGGSFAVELLLAAATAVGIFLIGRRSSLACAFALALAAGLMIGHHAYIYDCVLLLPAVLLPFEESSPEWLRMWALFMLTPLPYMLILSEAELPGHLAVTGYTVAVIAAMWFRHRHTRPAVA
jgi:hypothetical protein